MSQKPDDQESRRHDTPDRDAIAEEEAAAAAAEAASIGGPTPDDHLDPAERPVAEGGGGVAEGFEQAEEGLVRQASHEDVDTPPREAAFETEPEGDRASGVHGEPDEVDSTEVVRDPGEDDDDSGA